VNARFLFYKKTTMAKEKKNNKKTKKTSKKKVKKVFGKLKKKSEKSAKKVLVKKKKKKVLRGSTIILENVAFIVLLSVALLFGILVLGVGRELESAQKTAKVPTPVVSQFEKEIGSLVGDHPIREMTPFIAGQKREVAKYLVAIAKKESNWGKFSPKKDGKECYNYWGYRGTYNQTDSGYSCFDNPRQAVKVVGGRIGELIAQDIKTPEDMIVWKCGSSCAGHGDENVQKWIDDVDYYYSKL